MGRIFTAPINVADMGTDADQDVFVLATGSGAKAILHGFEIYSDVASATNLALELVRRSGAGSGGATVTEEDLDEDTDLTAESAITVNVTTPGTEVASLKAYHWEQLGPLSYWPTPEMRPRVNLSSFLALHLETDPANASLRGWVVWEEI